VTRCQQRPGGWDEPAVIAAIHAWTARFGGPPTAADWNPALARGRGDHAVADLFDAERPRWPVSATVRRICGSWNAALAAAGHRTRQDGIIASSSRAIVAPAGAYTGAWTQAEVIAAMRAHRDLTGSWPTSSQWALRDNSGRRPLTKTVQRLFGAWSTAVTIAHIARGQ